MKAGLISSSIAHAIILTWGLWSLSAPAPMQVADVEALPVDIVPIEEFTKSVKGEKKADLKDKPAPVPTQRPDPVPDAVNAGDSNNDAQSKEAAKSAEQAVETAKAKPSPKPEPTPEPKPDPAPEPVKESQPAPSTELAAVNQPSVPVTEQAAAENAKVSEDGEQFAALPKTAPIVPESRPEPPKPQRAATQERKKSEQPAEKKTAAKASDSTSTEDEISALLNKQESAQTGAKSSRAEASLGTRKGNSSGELSQSEMDALKAQLASCWSIPAGAAGGEELMASVEFDLDQGGKLVGRPRVVKSSGNRTFDSSAVRAIQICDRDGLRVPEGKYSIWNEVQVNFDPREMF